MIVGIIFGIAIGLCGLLTLIFPGRKYLKNAIRSIFGSKYTVNEYLEKEPDSGILKGEVETEKTIIAPLSGKKSALYKIKEKTRNYHSSGASKKTTRKTYFNSAENYLYSQGKREKFNLGKKTEIRSSETTKEKSSYKGKIPLSFKKLREGKDQEIKKKTTRRW